MRVAYDRDICSHGYMRMNMDLLCMGSQNNEEDINKIIRGHFSRQHLKKKSFFTQL